MYDAIFGLVPGETAKWNNIKEPYIRKTCAVKPPHILSITSVREKRGTTVPNHYIKSLDNCFQLTKTPFDFVAMDKQSIGFKNDIPVRSKYILVLILLYIRFTKNRLYPGYSTRRYK
jgi:hypothetical protein